MAEYARREGFDADAAYRSRRVLRRTGQWVEADGAAAVSKPAALKKREAAVRFARHSEGDAAGVDIVDPALGAEERSARGP